MTNPASPRRPLDNGTSPRRLFALAAALFGALLLAAQTVSLRGYIGSDFKIFHWTARRFAQDPAQLYHDASLLSLQGYLHPPPSIVFFLPLNRVSLESGFALFSLLMLASAALASYLWLRLLARDGLARPTPAVAAATLILMLASGSVFSARAGQIDPLILLLCVSAVALMARTPLLAGMLIGIGAWIKIYPLLLLIHILFLPRSIWPRALLGIALAGALGLSCALLLMPEELIWRYFSVFLPTLSGRTIINIYNQSLSAIALRLTLPIQEGMTTFNTYPVPTVLGWSIRAAVVAGLLITSTMARQGQDALYRVALILAAIPLVAPLGWGHAFVYALPLASLVLLKACLHSGAMLCLAGFAYCLLLPTAHHRFPYLQGLPEAVFHVLFARYAIATLIFCGMAVWFLRREQRARTPT